MALHLTPSAVSQQLAALAREAGAPVIERDGRGVRLTPAAQVLLTHADELFAQFERLEADLEASAEGLVGTVTVGAFQSATASLVIPAAAALRARRARLAIGVVQADAPAAFDELAARRLDVVVSIAFPSAPHERDRRFSRRPLLDDRMRVALPADHRCAAQGKVGLRQLADETWIGAQPGSACRHATSAACAAAGFTPTIAHAVDDYALALSLVAAGLGVGFVPTLAPASIPAGVVLRDVEDPAPSRAIFAATRCGAESSPAVAAVLDALEEQASAWDDPTAAPRPLAS